MKLPLFYLVFTDNEWAFTWKGKTTWTLMQIWSRWNYRQHNIVVTAYNWFFVTYGINYANADLANYITLNIVPLHNPLKVMQAISRLIRQYNRKKRDEII